MVQVIGVFSIICLRSAPLTDVRLRRLLTMSYFYHVKA